MKAVVMTAPGPPEVLQVAEVPTPGLNSSTAVLVKLYAAGINPIDTKLRSRGTFYPDQRPAILGCDGAGVITAIGAAVQTFQVGDAVYFCQGGLGAQPGTYAEYAVVESRCLALKPRSLSFAAAAAAPLVLITAWEALRDRVGLQAGQSVLIPGGAGGVGHVAIQLAKLIGAQVYTTVSTAAKADFVRAIGADQVILYPTAAVAPAILAATHGAGVDVAFDTVGGAVLSECFAATKIYGDVVSLLAPDPATVWTTARQRNQRVSFELMLTPMLQGLTTAQQHQAQILHQCAQWIDSGQLQIHVTQTLPLTAAAAAHRQVETGGMVGKLALTIAAEPTPP